MTAAESLRELGNKRFKEGLFAEAVRYYLKAKVFLPTGTAAYAPVKDGDEQAARARTCQIAVGSNAAACKLKLGEYDACIRMCDGILMLDPRSVKALFRKAVALRALGDAAEEEPETILRQAAEIEPNDPAIQRELADIARLRRKGKEQEKRIAKKMFG